MVPIWGGGGSVKMIETSLGIEERKKLSTNPPIGVDKYTQWRKKKMQD